ncbi:Arm DNA-binding domain-containing protein [Sphingomonas sp. FW199]|uniref:Arm DNA-binding domain-containing protein n=1 Tax=Sphingomonas sp. FW199 TaxID=3400217 RepID=UPI003CF4BE52
MLPHLRISAAKPYKLSDGQGLFLTVQPNGSKLRKLNFRHLGKQKTLHLGIWPDVGLADARGRRDEARRLIAAGRDPAVEKKRAGVAAIAAAAILAIATICFRAWVIPSGQCPKTRSTRRCAVSATASRK